ncbi:MAG: hypothetical protein HETSPECPRED_000006 [Heterodermia speciosa]|uniref:Heterokaryon incompatibility domain-containing protein n=1 Tax=Heterodermia speciosa TaxID=116794 RepID=A0A8H3ECA7_9LECA|nr:MAG: hypothetical protein HETSPECPRED_000006 [Heterodermia speciosa]
MEGYTYHDLNKHDFTRIVIVEPGETPDKLQCSLRTNRRLAHHSSSTKVDASVLTTKPPTATGLFYNQRQSSSFGTTDQDSQTWISENLAYHALSYVWGSLRPDVPIICDGQDCFISRNLDQALRRLRKAKEPLHIWADAMCINQKNILERNEQVARMKQIYQWAENVSIWLGDEDEETDLVVRLLEAHRKKVHEPWFSVRTEFGPHAPEWAAMIKWLNRPWFWRVWTIQEARVAKEAFIHFGPHSISLAIVDSVLSLHVSRDVNHNLAGHLEEAFRLPGLSVRLNESNTWDWDSDKSLLDILLSSRRHQATDPRDKVYGILGLVPNLSEQDLRNPLIKPDYTKATARVYKDAAIFSMMRDQSLRTIQAVYHGDRFLWNQNSLSWVPYWDQQDGPILLGERRGPPRRFLETTESTIPIFNPTKISQGVLSVNGNIKATVRVVLSNISQEELGQRDDRGRATVFDRLWAELRDEIGSPIYEEESHLILDYIEALTVGINGRGEFRRLYGEFFRTVHWMWGHVPVKIRSGDSSPFSSSGNPDETTKREEWDILGPVSDENESDVSIIDSTSVGQCPQKRDEGLVSLVENPSNEGSDRDNSSSKQLSAFQSDDDEELASSMDSAADFFRFDPGICELCEKEQPPSSLHSYLTNDPDHEELPGSKRDPNTFQYRIDSFFQNSWNYGAADGRFGGASLDFLAPCIDACNLRRFFITDDQLFGIGPQAMRPGDIITSLKGATFLCVLRKAETSAAELGIDTETTHNLYHLIGECYIQGERGSLLSDGKSSEDVVFDII